LQLGFGFRTLRPEIGDLRDGGVVFWVDETGQRGLVCAIEDQTTAIQWYNGVGSSDISTAANDRRIGSGAENTTKIINAYGATTTDYAAGLEETIKVEFISIGFCLAEMSYKKSI
jgi:hypothetical protein